jgi:large subunit ribosomal protein L3
MNIGLVGRKIGMTRIFTEDGASVPVTVLDVSNNRVSQVKTEDNDGYASVQLAFGSRRNNRVNKSQAGHFAKAGVEAAEVMREFPVSADVAAQYQTGVTGVTQGKGFAGTIKRHHFKSQRASHGNSRSHNVPGSIGMAQDPGRVFPGKRMAGHLGSVKSTVQNLEVVRVDAERGLLLVKGAVPGSKGGQVVVRPAVKGGA